MAFLGDNETTYTVLEKAAEAAKAGKLKLGDVVEFNKWFKDNDKGVRVDFVNDKLEIQILGMMESPEKARKSAKKAEKEG